MSLWVQSLRIFTMQIRLCLKALFVFLGGGNDRKGIFLRGQVKKLRETLRKVDYMNFYYWGCLANFIPPYRENVDCTERLGKLLGDKKYV